MNNKNGNVLVLIDPNDPLRSPIPLNLCHLACAVLYTITHPRGEGAVLTEEGVVEALLHFDEIVLGFSAAYPVLCTRSNIEDVIWYTTAFRVHPRNLIPCPLHAAKPRSATG